jgi:hypothetical protein
VTEFDNNYVYGIEGRFLTELSCLSDVLKRSDDVETSKIINKVLAEASPVFRLAADERIAA